MTITRLLRRMVLSMIKEQRKDIDEMTKAELRCELDNMRIEYDIMTLRNDIMKLVDRMVLSTDLQKIKDYTEKIYKQEMELKICIVLTDVRSRVLLIEW